MRTRGEALIESGVDCHLLYLEPGSGLHNPTPVTTHVSNDDMYISSLIAKEEYDAIFVACDVIVAERVRGYGYDKVLVLEVQGLGPQEQAKEILLSWVHSVNAYCTAAIYPQTRHLKEIFKAYYPNLPQFCFPNLIDTERFGYREVPPLGFPVLAWVGRLEPNKNWREFLEIGYWIHKQVPDVQLWIFGDASLDQAEDQLRFYQSLAELDMTPYVHRLNNVSSAQMAVYLSQIGDSGGLLYSTSITEGFGYAVLEAMLCRCPVVSTDSDGIRNFLVPGSTGNIYLRGDITEGVLQGFELMRNSNFREKIVRQAERHVRRHFSKERYVRHFMKMMRALGVEE